MFRSISLVTYVLCLLLALGIASPASQADNLWRALHEEVAAGRVKPLSEILDSLATQWIGEVLEVEIEREDGQWIYEIELLGAEGQVVEFEIDAATGAILEIEGRNIEAMRRP